MKVAGGQHNFWLSQEKKEQLVKEAVIRKTSLSGAVALAITLLANQSKRQLKKAQAAKARREGK